MRCSTCQEVNSPKEHPARFARISPQSKILYGSRLCTNSEPTPPTRKHVKNVRSSGRRCQNREGVERSRAVSTSQMQKKSSVAMKKHRKCRSLSEMGRCEAFGWNLASETGGVRISYFILWRSVHCVRVCSPKQSQQQQIQHIQHDQCRPDLQRQFHAIRFVGDPDPYRPSEDGTKEVAPGTIWWTL